MLFGPTKSAFEKDFNELGGGQRPSWRGLREVWQHIFTDARQPVGLKDHRGEESKPLGGGTSVGLARQGPLQVDGHVN